MDAVKFTETVFSSKNKKGVLVPDSDGYYEMVVGALNTYNSAGEYYTAEGAVQLFESSSHLMRRIKSGALYSELGHPKKDPGMTMEQFYSRVVSLEETNICGHFSEIRLDFQFGKNHPELNNPELIAVIAKVKPAGAKASALQLSFENRKQAVNFSIRGLTENKYRNGRTERRLTNIITFDMVCEPGVAIASKQYSPCLEARIATESCLTELLDLTVDHTTLKRVLTRSVDLVGMESSRELYQDILKSLEPKKANRLSAW
jgi:hypothetical protein